MPSRLSLDIDLNQSLARSGHELDFCQIRYQEKKGYKIFLNFDQNLTRPRLRLEFIYIQSMTRVSPQTLQQISRPDLGMTQCKKWLIVQKLQINSRSSLDLVKVQLKFRKTLLPISLKIYISKTLVQVQIQSNSNQSLDFLHNQGFVLLEIIQ